MVINVLVLGPRHGEMVSSNLLQCYISVQEMFCVLFFDYEMSPITCWGRKIGNCVRMAHESGLMRLFDGVFFFFFGLFLEHPIIGAAVPGWALASVHG